MEEYETSNAQEWNADSERTFAKTKRTQLSKPGDRLPPHLRLARPVEKITIKAASDKLPGAQQAVLGSSAPAPRADPNGNTHRGECRVPLENVPLEQDNEAKAAWRMNLPPTGSITLPCNYQELDSGQVSRAHTNARYATLEQIGLRTGTYIRPPTTYSDRVLRIWGNSSQVDLAKSEISKWIRSRKSVTAHGERASEFAKVYSLSDRQKANLDKQMREDAKRQGYRQTPSNTDVFQAIGYFLWPSAELRPDVCLGKSFEVLDPIRMAHGCYIVFDSSRSIFKVMSNNANAISEVLSRLRGTVCDVVSRNNEPIRLYLVDPPSCTAIRKHVDFIKTDNHCVIPTIAGAQLSQEELDAWKTSRLNQESSNQQRLKAAIIRCLTNLLYYRGHVRMRVYFGTLVLSSYKKPTGEKHTLEEFLAMMNSSQTRANLVQDLEHSKVEGDLISRCCKSASLLEPVDALTSKLENVEPNYSARFQFLPVDDAGPLMLEVQFSRAPQTDEYEVAEKRWFRGPLKQLPLDLNVLNLESANNSLDDARVTAEMRHFVDHLKFKQPAKASATNFAKQPKLGFPRTAPVQVYDLKTAYRYKIQNSVYRFELARHQSSPTGSDSSPTEGRGKEALAVRWGASLYSNEWDAILSQQSSLNVGQSGMWTARLNTFFPPDRASVNVGSDAGFQEFLSKLETVSKLVKGDV
ncbi:MAG: hypothetical protein M1836_005550 [Candelina mexicana]|nr:MAG: hypothetical protein M1836_005550 [Candelina mexicana]